MGNPDRGGAPGPPLRALRAPGLEHVSLTPGVSPGFALDHIDWSQSLLMAGVWSGIYGALFLRMGPRIVGVMAVAAFSHFVLDLPMHPPDLALWPGTDVHLGAGLGQRLPTGWRWVELTAVALAAGYYLHGARSSTRFGRKALAVVGVVVALHLFKSPWLSPL